jgi:hypothetical protein
MQDGVGTWPKMVMKWACRVHPNSLLGLVAAVAGSDKIKVRI